MSELIDREATVKQICKIGEMVGGHDRDVVISIALFVQDDKTAFPTVERPHGEWKETTHEVVCSNCGHNIEPRLFGVYMRYCCVCGSDNWKEGDSDA